MQISPEYLLEVINDGDPFSHLTTDEHVMIERIWEEEMQRRKGSLFNGRLFSAIDVNSERLLGRFIPYKLYLASIRNPDLQQILKIYPVSITGRTLYHEKILIGKRSIHVTQYPGFYELIPSGGVDDQSIENGKINLKLQYRIELEEEAGILQDNISNIEIKTLEYDNNLYEICADIFLKKETDVHFKSLEHDELHWIPLQNLRTFLDSHQNEVLPIFHKLCI